MCLLTILSQGSSRLAALSSSSEYCTSSHSLCSALSGSFRDTGIDTRDRSLPTAREREIVRRGGEGEREGGREGGGGGGGRAGEE